MVTFDSEDFQKQLQDIAKRFRERLEKGVEKFAYKTADIFIQSTPYGDIDKYYDYYEERQLEYGFRMQPGLAKGSWLLSTGQPAFSEEVAYDTRSGSKSQARAQMTAQEYVLGETIYLTNSVPYIIDLERGQSRQAPAGMLQLSMTKLVNLYSLNVAKILTGEKQPSMFDTEGNKF
jgi:hypothetical protein